MTLHQMIMVVVESVIVGGIGGMVVGVLMVIVGGKIGVESWD